MTFPDCFIHPSAWIDSSAVIGKGTSVWMNVQVREHARIGEHCTLSKDVYIDHHVCIGHRCKIQNGVSIYHGVMIDDDVFVGPGVFFVNDRLPRAFNTSWQVIETRVHEGASIGAQSTLLCGVTLGPYCMVAAGSVVTHDVGAFVLVKGHPARPYARLDRDGNIVELL